jgi:hypothetical protein
LRNTGLGQCIDEIPYSDAKRSSRQYLREEDHLEDPGVDGRIIFERLGGGADWIDLAQDRDRWRALVNTVMNLRVP